MVYGYIGRLCPSKGGGVLAAGLVPRRARNLYPQWGLEYDGYECTELGRVWAGTKRMVKQAIWCAGHLPQLLTACCGL